MNERDFNDTPDALCVELTASMDTLEALCDRYPDGIGHDLCRGLGNISGHLGELCQRGLEDFDLAHIVMAGNLLARVEQLARRLRETSGPDVSDILRVLEWNARRLRGVVFTEIRERRWAA